METNRAKLIMFQLLSLSSVSINRSPTTLKRLGHAWFLWQECEFGGPNNCTQSAGFRSFPIGLAQLCASTTAQTCSRSNVHCTCMPHPASVLMKRLLRDNFVFEFLIYTINTALNSSGNPLLLSRGRFVATGISEWLPLQASSRR